MNREFLQAVTADGGFYAIVGMSKGKLREQLFVETLDEVETTVQGLVEKERDIFFGLAKFGTPNERTRANAVHVKAFWLDLDCGEGKPYEDKNEAIADLGRFCKEVGLPKPTIVGSGGGVHVYWPLDEAITIEQWGGVAESLKALCVRHDLRADPAVTADAARILRIPGTMNYKSGEGRPVEIIVEGKARRFEDLKSRIGEILPAPKKVRRPMDAITKALMGNYINKFSTIQRRIEEDKGCPQIKHMIENQATLEEPLWRAVLSVAVYCDDGDTAIHEVSKAHPDYTHEGTEGKVATIKGPYTCATFEKLRPGGCEGCPHRGNITSPIQIGAEIARATEEDNEVKQKSEIFQEEITFKIPSLPFPYFRGKNGGIYREPFGDEEDPTLIYENDLYLVKRVLDGEDGESLSMRLHLPQDGVREFTMSLTEALSKDACRNALAKQGVVALPGKPMDAIMSYIARATKEMQMTQQSETASVRFGWNDDDSKFILGEREIDNAGNMNFCPPSTVTRNTAPLLRKRGELDQWKKVFNTYATEGMEANAFGALCAFGAPLFKFTNHKGLLVNYVSKESGTGKSTILRMCNSVYGHPDKLMLHAEDTKLSRLHRFGVMAHLPVTIDEITNMKPEDFSDLAYAITLGRPRNRMQSQVNAERLNSAEWATIMLSSSNASFYEKMQQIKSMPEGELMRVFEIKTFANHSMDKGQADEIFSLMFDNYGIAGEIYIRWVASHLPEVLDFMEKTQQQFDNEICATNKERYWSAGVASILTGAHFAKQLGLHDYNLKRIYRWAADMVTYSRAEVESLKVDHDMVLGDYIRNHINNILIINDEIDKRLGMGGPAIREPRNELRIRYEPDTKLIFIPIEDLRNWCAQRQLYYKELVSELKQKGIFLKAEKKRLGKGTDIPTPPSYCAVLDSSKGHFIDVISTEGESE
jgi:hypothetical protein